MAQQTVSTAKPSASRVSSCPGYDSAEINVSADSIGPIALDSSMGVIAGICPGYRTQTDEIETTEVLDWVFEFGGVTVTATQFDTTIDKSQPAENWLVFGHPVLPGHIRLPSTWGEVRAHYPGPAKLQLGELGPIARLCDLPWLEFSLEFYYSAADIDTMTAASIPPAASIRNLFIHRPGKTEPWQNAMSCASGL